MPLQVLFRHVFFNLCYNLRRHQAAVVVLSAVTLGGVGECLACFPERASTAGRFRWRISGRAWCDSRVAVFTADYLQTGAFRSGWLKDCERASPDLTRGPQNRVRERNIRLQCLLVVIRIIIL